MAGPARTHWEHLKAPLKTDNPELYKKFSKGFGPALDNFENAALKKVKKGASDDEAAKAVASEKAKVLAIASQYYKLIKDAKVDVDKYFPNHFFSHTLARHLDRFPIAAAMGKDVKSCDSWAGW